ncbi:MAG: TlyA family RNA methyltransferase [Patescibacteria group bacterium]|nr:TlyA family RNA methyltransferase [Patescibacteria group bacterium]MCL5093655.1 TlyA family RNA methyltransferase [Patescibacteria group bacterium]
MKKRLDVLVYEKGFAKSREESQRLIMAGLVSLKGRKLDKSGMMIEETEPIEVEKLFPYVSRGALKIEKAYEEFKLDFKDKIVCDIGASTGGFTDFALQHDAKKSYAIDVGWGQLDEKLRKDLRVVVMEKTNIKNVQSLPESIDIFTIDVSFISLKQVLPKVRELAKISSQVIALIKPQFEVGKEIADRYKGVIKDEKIREEVVQDIKNFAEELDFKVKGVTESPILGAKGNKEFLIHLFF